MNVRELLMKSSEQIQQKEIDFYLSKHISEVKDMNDMDNYRFFRGQSIYNERCKALLKAALEEK